MCPTERYSCVLEHFNGALKMWKCRVLCGFGEWDLEVVCGAQCLQTCLPKSGGVYVCVSVSFILEFVMKVRFSSIALLVCMDVGGPLYVVEG